MPSPAALARRLQRLGNATRDIIRAFRGVGKSYISAAYVLWRLLRNPRDEKILVVSATGNKSKEFVSQVKTILATWGFLTFLRPREDERNQADRFDVAGASIAQSHSLKAVGITGQITGSRATLIVADDVEIEGNSKTEEARQRILRTLSEFEAIVGTGSSNPSPSSSESYANLTSSIEVPKILRSGGQRWHAPVVKLGAQFVRLGGDDGEAADPLPRRRAPSFP